MVHRGALTMKTRHSMHLGPESRHADFGCDSAVHVVLQNNPTGPSTQLIGFWGPSTITLIFMRFGP